MCLHSNEVTTETEACYSQPCWGWSIRLVQEHPNQTQHHTQPNWTLNSLTFNTTELILKVWTQLWTAAEENLAPEGTACTNWADGGGYWQSGRATEAKHILHLNTQLNLLRSTLWSTFESQVWVMQKMIHYSVHLSRHSRRENIK